MLTNNSTNAGIEALPFKTYDDLLGYKFRLANHEQVLPITLSLKEIKNRVLVDGDIQRDNVVFYFDRENIPFNCVITKVAIFDPSGQQIALMTLYGPPRMYLAGDGFILTYDISYNPRPFYGKPEPFSNLRPMMGLVVKSDKSIAQLAYAGGSIGTAEEA